MNQISNKILIQLITLCYSLTSYSQTQVGNEITVQAQHIETSSNGSTIAIIEDYNGTVRVKTYFNENSIWITNVGNDLSYDDLGIQNSSLSMSKDGNFLAVGSSNRNFNSPDPELMSIGIVRVYENINNQWIQVGSDLKTGNQLDGFGNSSRGNGTDLSADGSIIAIGALDYYGNGEFGDDNGLVRVFKNNQGTWEQLGSDIVGETSTHTGQAVSLSDNGLVLAIGAGKYQNFTGQIKVYKFENDDWQQVGSGIDGEAENDLLGSTLSISSSGNRIAVSTPNPGGRTLGYAKIYENINDSWIQIGETIRSDGSIVNFGVRISLSSDGTELAIGSGGATRIYKVTDNSIVDLDIEIESTGFVMSLSSDGSRVIVVNETLDETTSSTIDVVLVYNIEVVTTSVLGAPHGKGNLVKLYPNPAREFVKVNWEKFERAIVSEFSGKRLFESNSPNIDLRSLNSGIYLLTLIGASNERKIFRIIIE